MLTRGCTVILHSRWNVLRIGLGKAAGHARRMGENVQQRASARIAGDEAPTRVLHAVLKGV